MFPSTSKSKHLQKIHKKFDQNCGKKTKFYSVNVWQVIRVLLWKLLVSVNQLEFHS